MGPEGKHGPAARGKSLLKKRHEGKKGKEERLNTSSRRFQSDPKGLANQRGRQHLAMASSSASTGGKKARSFPADGRREKSEKVEGTTEVLGNKTEPGRQ